MGGFPNFYRLSKRPIRNDDNSCDFSILTTLVSPRAAIIFNVKAGDILQIVINNEQIEARTVKGELAGVILSSSERIKSCIEKGEIFTAKIVLLNGAECQVIIEKAQ